MQSLHSLPVTSSQDARSLASSLTFLIRLSRALAGAGRPVDLTGLDDRVGLLRARMMDLDPEESTELKPCVFQLASEIDAFCAAHAQALPQASLLRVRAYIAAMLDSVPAANPA